MAENRVNMPFEPNLHSAGEYWKGLSRPVQVSIIAVILAFIISVILLIGYVTRPGMEVLFRSMDSQQAREVTERLDEMGVSYELADGGSTILVPEEQQDHLRIQLSPDLYAKGMGFSIFEEDGLMISDHDRQKQWQVVKQDELARTISSINAVQWSRVHLVMPEEGVFLRDRAEPSASVFLNLNPLETLTDRQVEGILSMVASSVTNLEKANIAIVDESGEAYHDPYMPDDEGSSVPAEVQERLHAQRNFEQQLEDKLTGYLEVVFGSGNVVAMVNAELDFDMHESTSVTYDPDNVERAIHRIQEREEGQEGPPPEEVAEPNIPGYEAPVGAGGDYAREYLEETINYEISEINEYLSRSPGRVDHLSATVILNRDEQEGVMEDVSTLVAAAIGHNPERGDMIAVQSIPFDTTVTDDVMHRDAVEELQRMVLYAIIAGVVLLMIIIALLYLRGRARYAQSGEEEEQEILEGFDIGELVSQQEPEEIEEDIRDRVRKIAEQEPENVAYLLRSWMAEE